MHEQVRHYYVQVLHGTADKIEACCTAVAPPEYSRAAIGRVNGEVRDRYTAAAADGP